MENVFIAWSGNYALAEQIAAQLESRGFHAVVGGGAPHDMYIGAQVQAQMDACAYAIILAQKKKEVIGYPEFSDNVMFEWGYLISRLPSKNVYAFLIDTSERELPSDLIGSWIIAVSSEGRGHAELAVEIVDRFEVEAQSINKLEIMSRWKEIKPGMKKHQLRKIYSNYEMAQFILFSLKSAYYHDEMKAMYKALSSMPPASGTLGAVVEEAQLIAALFVKTSNLARRLEIEDYFELTTALRTHFEDGVEERDLRQWVEILRLDAISLCNVMIANEDVTDEDVYYLEESLEWGAKTLKLIRANVEEFPENKYYAKLMNSYQYRNQAVAYEKLGMPEKARECFSLAVREREGVYFQYRRSHPDDSVLCSKLAQEYYLSLLESAQYEDDPREKLRITSTVKKFMRAWQEDYERQQTLFDMVKKAYDALN